MENILKTKLITEEAGRKIQREIEGLNISGIKNIKMKDHWLERGRFHVVFDFEGNKFEISDCFEEEKVCFIVNDIFLISSGESIEEILNFLKKYRENALASEFLDFAETVDNSNLSSGKERNEKRFEEGKTREKFISTFYRCWGKMRVLENDNKTTFYDEIKEKDFRPTFVNGVPYQKEQNGTLVPVFRCVAVAYKIGDRYRLTPIPAGKRPTVSFEDIPKEVLEKRRKFKLPIETFK